VGIAWLRWTCGACDFCRRGAENLCEASRYTGYGVVVLAGIHMSAIPAMEYGPHLFHEKTLRSVEANTRRDGEELLREAAEIPIRPAVVSYPLDAANDALAALKTDRLAGTGVLLA
jgi:alcohol dehydrogenase, propanol-preferring